MDSTAITGEARIDKLITRSEAIGGGSLFLATLSDGGYAILHHGQIVSLHTGDGAVERAVQAFERLRVGDQQE